MKKILLLAYRYPPQSGIGAVRPFKLKKYLDLDGYRVDVISVSCEGRRDSAVVSIPHSRAFNSLLSRRAQAPKQQTDSAPGTRPRRRAGVLRSFVYKLVYHYLISLDYFYQFKKYYRKNSSSFKDYDAVISTVSPTSVLLCAQYLKKKRPKLDWICDFRDPLVCPDEFSRWEILINRHIQNRACRIADAVTTVSEGFARRICGEEFHEKCSVIPNGFDPDDVKELAQTQPDGFSFTYTGVLYGEMRDLSPLFAALKKLIRSGLIAQGDVALRYAGSEGALFCGFAERFGLSSCVENFGLVSRERSLELQLSSRFLLLSTWNTQEEWGVFPGKFLEYMSAMRPVVALVNGSRADSEVTQVLERLRLGLACEQARPGDNERLEAFLLSEYERFKRGEPAEYAPDREGVLQYSWVNTVKRFEKVIERREDDKDED